MTNIPCLAVIGGSGLYQLPELEIISKHEITTPYGNPSAPIVEATLGGARLLFLPRHGEHHQHAPHRINYRANICALKMLGAELLLSISAVGSLKEEFRPGDAVLVDQFVDMTRSRISTFFDEAIVAHVSMAEPTCELMRGALFKAIHAMPIRLHDGGTYICMEGPQFSSRAESEFYRKQGFDVIGMTAMPEAKLAREAQLPYALLALVTDYDCWRTSEVAVSVKEVLATLGKNVTFSRSVVPALIPHLPAPEASQSSRALEHSMISEWKNAPEECKLKLQWLLDSRG